LQHPGKERGGETEKITSTTSATFDKEKSTKTKSAEVTMQQIAAQKITLAWADEEENMHKTIEFYFAAL
jgi:hypothetical protein